MNTFSHRHEVCFTVRLITRGGMVDATWFLLAWIVVALAAILKFWSMTASFRQKKPLDGRTSADRQRAQLEKLWQQTKT